MITLPEFGAITFIRILNMVDLPEPVRPIIPSFSPVLTLNERFYITFG